MRKLITESLKIHSLIKLIMVKLHLIDYFDPQNWKIWIWKKVKQNKITCITCENAEHILKKRIYFKKFKLGQFLFHLYFSVNCY